MVQTKVIFAYSWALNLKFPDLRPFSFYNKTHIRPPTINLSLKRVIFGGQICHIEMYANG